MCSMLTLSVEVLQKEIGNKRFCGNFVAILEMLIKALYSPLLGYEVALLYLDCL